MEKRRVLIIDDDTTVASIIADMVRSFGHFPVVAWNRETALSLWRETKQGFDLVIVDFLLGSSSGATLAVKLAKEKPNVPFILMSGMSEDQVDLPQGKVQYLGKPFSVEALGKKIEAAFKPSIAS